MNYEKYYSILTEENRRRKNEFPDNKVFSQSRASNKYTNIFMYKEFKYNFTISTPKSNIYGEEFEGLIVELLCERESDYFESFNDLKSHQNQIEAEFQNLELIWSNIDDSRNGTRWRVYSKLEANIEDESKWREYIDWQLNTMIKFLEVFPKYTKELKKERKRIMTEEEARKIIEKFIKNELERNEIDEYDDEKFIELETPTGQKFIIYKKNQEKSIFVKPKNGNQNFSEPIKRIIDYVVHNNSSHHNDNSYIIPIANKIFKNAITEFISNPKPGNKMKIKNIVLYGAPGVGKTHNYKKLISLIEKGELKEKEIFKEIENSTEKYDLEDFDDDLKSRVEFITFHQSFGYEDFIEGFRPQKNGNIEIEDGIFKIISDKASSKIILDNDILINRIIQSDRTSYTISDITNEMIYIKKENDSKLVPFPKKLVLELLENIKEERISIEDIKNRNLENLDLSFDKYMYGYNSILYNICKSLINDIEYIEEKNFYLVIDEINRGNISKIFGELITLIEESKRDKYEVTLPYSKQKFSVPLNLFIIGTMNTTDKSIALIDVALRRRFTFIKMQPNSELVHAEVKDLFEKLNEKITEDIGEDYQIGHSYFMNIEKEDIPFILKYKIKPLLEEYYYGDDKMSEAIKMLGLEE